MNDLVHGKPFVNTNGLGFVACLWNKKPTQTWAGGGEVIQASRSYIQLCSGWFWKRHLRKGPAMTFR